MKKDDMNYNEMATYIAELQEQNHTHCKICGDKLQYKNATHEFIGHLPTISRICNPCYSKQRRETDANNTFIVICITVFSIGVILGIIAKTGGLS